MRSEQLPIFKATLDLCIYIDTMVKNQEKYHKYGIGSEIDKIKVNSYNLYNKVGKIDEKDPFDYDRA